MPQHRGPPAQHLSHEVVGRARGISFGWVHEVDSRMTAAGLVDVKSVEYSRTTAGGEVGCLPHANLNRQAEPALRQAGATGGRKSVDHAG